jgi:hypothetical protein
MKGDLESGGLNVTDVECLNSALKLRKFIRAKKVIIRSQIYN